uniref:Uncharacterized protein n=1 Tax=Rhizophora mucronata TaxID=61149 RepID=A0A2P2QGK4_RHIMU
MNTSTINRLTVYTQTGVSDVSCTCLCIFTYH